MERKEKMEFAEAARKSGQWTSTEKGAVALNTTGDARLDFFATIGALRRADEGRIERLFAEAYKQDPLFATKIAFYARDVRGGLGERRVFRVLMNYMAYYHPEALRPNLDLIGVYGRYDDLYELISTPLEDDMWAAMKKQFEEDRESLANDRAVSLLGKWVKTADASSEKTRRLGIMTAQKLGYSVYDYKRIVRDMRRQIGIVERLMSAGQWEDIHYPDVPGRAMMIYRKAFERNDGDRYKMFINKAVKGEETIHSATLYPYDIVEKILYRDAKEDKTLEAQWRQLPDYVEKGTNALVIADTSGSMTWNGGRPLATSVGLAIYFAERNKGAYHNMWMSFSETPRIQILKGETLYQKITGLDMSGWTNNTNLKAAFKLVLKIAVENKVLPEEMPKALIVISDMEIDHCGNKEWTFYDKMAERFRSEGYKIPNIIFWNVASRNDVFHADKKRAGVQLCSGQSASMFKQVLSAIGMTPVQAMEKTINAERYDCITIEQADNAE